MKKILLVFSLVLLLILSLIIVRVSLGGDEDNWICENGEWVAHGKPDDEKPEGSCGTNMDGTDAKDMVEAFYNWYIGFEGNPLSSGAYKTSEYLSENFRNKVDEILASFDKGGYDPFICAQDKPAGFEIGESEIMENEANINVMVKQDFYGSKRNIEVKVGKFDGEWKIDDIKCGSEKVVEKASDTEKVVLYFNNARRSPNGEVCEVVYGTERVIPKKTNMEFEKMKQLFGGPTLTEKNQGYSSSFSNETKDLVLGVKVDGSTAYVNMSSEMKNYVSNASCDVQAFISSVSETLLHDRKIRKVILAFDGNVESFYEWSQFGCSEENDFCDSSVFE